MTVGELIILLENYSRDTVVLAQDESGAYVSDVYGAEEVSYLKDDKGHLVIEDDDDDAKEWYNVELTSGRMGRAVIIRIDEW